ncbi:MAG TPA: hypothetical protein VF017_04915 [Thermoanaerobaculia bacterium]|nr:hypothetical protein [Thermoanaerobaculia bacterium]
MNWIHAHLVVNHLPVLGPVFALGLGAAGVILKKRDLERAAYVVLVLAALLTVAAFFTGEKAEEAAERSGAVNHRLIHEHEEEAEFARLVAFAAGALAAGAWWASRKGKTAPIWLRLLVLVGAGATLLHMAHTATHGGQIRHPALLDGAAAPAAGAEAGESDD